ncbi:MAG: AI-2E family transporter [Gemmatimonadetes bacterium]|nr:AI-2E family transporter [Gemmatimonadota bacterium]
MDPKSESGAWRVVYGVAVLLVLAWFLFSIRPVLSPVVLFLVLLLLLRPYAGTRLYVQVVSAAALLVFLWLLETTGSLLAPFILGLVLAYILNPAVQALERRRVPRWGGILLLALPALALVALAVIFGIPALARQLEQLIQSTPALVQRVLGWLERTRAGLLRLDLPLVQEEVIEQQLRALEPERVVAYLQARQEQIARWLWRAVLGVGKGVGFVLTLIGYLVLTPVLMFYLLRDWHGITGWLQSLMPERKREEWLGFVREYDTLLARYFRGQVLEAIVVGVLTWLGLFLLGFPYSGLVGAVAGVFNLVPYLGLLVSLVPAVIISLLSGNVLTSLLKVAIVFFIVQLLDGTVTGPRIVGGSVGLHPVWIMLALALGASFFGFVGLLLAVPAALLIKLLLRAGIQRYRSSAVYSGPLEVEDV